MIRLALLLLLILATIADAQDITVNCPSMFVRKQGIGFWMTDRIVCTATVKLPGETLTFPAFVIEPTPVRGIFNRAVDPCVSSGASADGSTLTLNLPRERIVLVGFTPTAEAMTATGSLTRPSGKVYLVSVRYPACPTSAVRGSLGRVRLAAPVTAVGGFVP